MWQSVIVYLVVAGAAGWVVWTVLLPGAWRAALRARLEQALGRAPTARSERACACDREAAD